MSVLNNSHWFKIEKKADSGIYVDDLGISELINFIIGEKYVQKDFGMRMLLSVFSVVNEAKTLFT